MATQPQIFAVNLTGGALFLDRLGLNVPASSSLELTLTAFVDEIQEDDSLYGFIDAGSMVLSFGDGNLSKGDSLNFFNVIPLEVRVPVRVLSDANIGSLSGTTTIDTTPLAVNDRVILTAQGTGSENGIWVIKAGAWERPQDFDVDESASSALVSVQEGATYADQVWQCTNNTGAGIIDTDSLAFQQISGSGSATTLQVAYEAGNTISATAAEGDIAFTLTSADFTVDGPDNFLIGASTALASFTADATAISLDSTDDSNLTMTASDGADKTLTIAASNGGAGDGLITITADGTIDVDAGGAVSINSSGGVINIGTDVVAQDINVGTGGVRTVNIGNATGATALDLDSGTGGTTLDSTGAISIDGVGASNFTTDAGDLTLSTTTSGAINVTGVADVNVSSGTTTDIQATGNVTIDSDTGSIGVGTDADDGAIDIGTGTTAGRVITIGNTTGTTTLNLNAGTGNVLVTAPTTTLTGDLVVQGTTTTVESEVVNIKDQFLYLNDGYETTGSPRDGGFVVNVDPQSENTTVAATGFTAGVAATSNPTVITAGSATFAAGDYIQIVGANDQSNDGLYEVLTHVGTTLTIAGIGLTGVTFDFVQNDFVTDTTVAGTIRKVEIGVYRVSAAGLPEFGYDGSSTTFAFNQLLSAATITLQAAYDGGDTITTSGSNPVTIAGSEKLQITATGGLDVDTVADFDVTTFDVQMTGTNGFSLDGTAASNVTADGGNLTLSTTTSGEVLIDGIDGVEINSTGGAIEVGNDGNTGAINIGTGAAARVITVGNSTGATGVVVNSGTEQVEVNGVTYYGISAGAPTATTSGFQQGDKYFDSTLDMEMRYDATRSKWLSVEAMWLQFGRNGNAAVGQYYRAINGRIMSATLGYPAPHDGTVVSLVYTRTDSDAATFDVVEGGVSLDTVASSATSGTDNTLDGDFSAGGILAVTNQAGGSQTSNVVAAFKVRFRPA